MTSAKSEKTKKVSLLTIAACIWAWLMAISVWIGWLLDVAVLRSFHPSAVAMNPLTALCFFILGVVLLLLRQTPGFMGLRTKRSLWLRVLAFVVAVFGLSRLADYAFGWELGWDQWLFRSQLNSGHNGFPNRMAPNTAVCFLLLGIAAVLGDAKRKVLRLFGPPMALVVFLLAWFALIGYAYEASYLYGLDHFIPMALPTAASFLILSAGIIVVRPHSGFMEMLNQPAPGSMLARRLVGVIILVPTILGGLRIFGERSGLFDMVVGTTLTAILNMIVLAAVVWMSALSLNREHQQRMKTEKDLDNARRAAESANRAKSHFLANMSHELRTPLNSIIGFSELLADRVFGDLNAKQEKYVNNIQDSGRHLLDLINDILDLSKIEAQRMKLEPVKVDIEKLTEGVVSVVSNLAARKNIRIEIANTAELPDLYADASKLKQILYNLLSNAIKFTPEYGQVILSGRILEAVPDSLLNSVNGFSPKLALLPGPYFECSVKDNGIGIALKDQPRLFKEFEQLDASYAREQEGTGLGLALTQRLVQMHGGAIWVESKGSHGDGSDFRFILPLSRTEQLPGGAKDKPDADQKHLDLVLVVEDNSAAIALLDQHLMRAGFATAHAHTGEQAIEMAARLQPRAITLDILLPDQTGWDVLKALKSDWRTQNIPVVIVSITDDRELGFSLGAVEYFVKPVDPRQLIESIERAARLQSIRLQSILVVDDDSATLELLEDVLRGEGYTVRTARGGEEALEAVRKHSPDLITLDLIMPGVNGFEVVRRLRGDPVSRNIPIMVYTSHELTREEEDELNAQVQCIAHKNGMEQFMDELSRLTWKPEATSSEGDPK